MIVCDWLCLNGIRLYSLEICGFVSLCLCVCCVASNDLIKWNLVAPFESVQ